MNDSCDPELVPSFWASVSRGSKELDEMVLSTLPMVVFSHRIPPVGRKHAFPASSPSCPDLSHPSFSPLFQSSLLGARAHEASPTSSPRLTSLVSHTSLLLW